MHIIPEIPSSVIREINGKTYFVRKFGINNKVLEEHNIPVPENKIVRTFDDTGIEIKSEIKPFNL